MATYGDLGPKATRLAELCVEWCGVTNVTMTRAQLLEFVWVLAHDAEAKELLDEMVAIEESEPEHEGR